MVNKESNSIERAEAMNSDQHQDSKQSQGERTKKWI